MPLRSRAELAASLLFVAAAVHAAEAVEEPHLDRPSVASLVNAPDVDALDTAYRGLRANAGLEVLYRSLRLRMQPNPTNELILLSTAPQTPDDYRLYRALADPALGTDLLGVLSSVVNNYYETLARLAIKNHVSLRPYLRLHALTDGYARTDSQKWLDWLFRHDKDAFVSAFRTLDATTKRAICGDDCGRYEPAPRSGDGR